MHRAIPPLRALRLPRAGIRRLDASGPLLLRPALRDFTAPRLRSPAISTRTFSTPDRRRNTVDGSRSSAAEPLHPIPTPLIHALPFSCPGCGAPTHTVDPHEAGYYTETRKPVQRYLNQLQEKETGSEDRIYDEAVNKLDGSVKAQLGLPQAGQDSTPPPAPSRPPPPICDRCHNLIHYSAGTPIYHPSLESIEATIAESPFKHNHIYHVLDAADFPMSLVPNLVNTLRLSPMRSQNRRSKHKEYAHGRIADVSFIITRSDLLAPTKPQVDSLMPYLVEVLRDALGRTGQNVRLGNVHCVSSQRGWWTRILKEKIYERGGAGWMVGKVNVGKSNLFEVVYPKGRKIFTGSNSAANDAFGAIPDAHQVEEQSPYEQEDYSLLPPPQKETEHPVMPIISSLPGTTASPIRIPFGKGKGELIDLPGIARSTLDQYVKPGHAVDLVMKSRIAPESHTVKPGQSLLLGGGLIRITPTTRDLIYLMYPFVPLDTHVTATPKALAAEEGNYAFSKQSIVADGTGSKMKPAGSFWLRWDVTKKHAGPLTRKDAVGLKPERLPFVVWSTDILIEGVGWVEVTAQARRGKPLYRNDGVDSDSESLTEGANASPDAVPYPEIDVVTPEGKFISIRRPMNGYQLNKSKTDSRARRRPRPSMVSVKNQRKPGTAT